MKRLNNERGAILITVIFLMAIIALVGAIAINTSTVDVQIAGYYKRATTAFEGAEGGADMSVPIVERTLAAGELEPTSFTVKDQDGNDQTIDLTGENLGNEITGGSDNDADTDDFTVPDLGGVEVDVDIDRMYTYSLPGGSIQFASGYEGIGASAAGAGTATLFRIKSKGEK